jgi:hypothetical protein
MWRIWWIWWSGSRCRRRREFCAGHDWWRGRGCPGSGSAGPNSLVSRERDGLAADHLDDDLDAYNDTISDSRSDLDEFARIRAELRHKTFPDICQTTQEAVDGVYHLYGTVRLLIRGLKADPPTRTTKTIGQDAAGNITGYIGTSIPATSPTAAPMGQFPRLTVWA